MVLDAFILIIFRWLESPLNVKNRYRKFPGWGFLVKCFGIAGYSPSKIESEVLIMNNNENKDMVNNLLDLLFDEGEWTETGKEDKQDIVNNLLDTIEES